ncbi:MAG: TlpA family protein disulfide reductase [candidate division Zixibacteria bacterium]|nr:TlpA family protein disulfide reductase [candidate division Zixibacteria bacterium]
MRIKTLAIIAIILSLTTLAFGQTKKGQKAPDFTLTDMDGNNITLSDVVGNGPVYINFWATWCAPCKKEIPELIKLYDEYKDRGFKILGITVDNARTLGKVKSFVESHNMDFTILLDSDSEVFRRKFKGRGIPFGFLLDNEGRIIHIVRGYIPSLVSTLTAKMKPFLLSDDENPPEDDSIEDNSPKEEPAPESTTPSEE